NRLSLSVVMGAIILASSYMVVHAGVPEVLGRWNLTQWLGLVGLGVAVFYGFIIFIGFLRSGGV
ncbi:MAG TPA: hypothetical protein VFF73_00165, partial [Planctomycetota bacterium]|nr:hypothetical protein [Planctomycetota bacterium]